jgi:hypothetical protein
MSFGNNDGNPVITGILLTLVKVTFFIDLTRAALYNTSVLSLRGRQQKMSALIVAVGDFGKHSAKRT